MGNNFQSILQNQMLLQVLSETDIYEKSKLANELLNDEQKFLVVQNLNYDFHKVLIAIRINSLPLRKKVDNFLTNSDSKKLLEYSYKCKQNELNSLEQTIYGIINLDNSLDISNIVSNTTDDVNYEEIHKWHRL